MLLLMKAQKDPCHYGLRLTDPNVNIDLQMQQNFVVKNIQQLAQHGLVRLLLASALEVYVRVHVKDGWHCLELCDGTYAKELISALINPNILQVAFDIASTKLSALIPGQLMAHFYIRWNPPPHKLVNVIA